MCSFHSLSSCTNMEPSEQNQLTDSTKMFHNWYETLQDNNDFHCCTCQEMFTWWGFSAILQKISLLPRRSCSIVVAGNPRPPAGCPKYGAEVSLIWTWTHSERIGKRLRSYKRSASALAHWAMKASQDIGLYNVTTSSVRQIESQKNIQPLLKIKFILSLI